MWQLLLANDRRCLVDIDKSKKDTVLHLVSWLQQIVRPDDDKTWRVAYVDWLGHF